MVDLIQLPYRHYGTATSMDLRLNLITGSMFPYTDHTYGRLIQLHPFISGQIKKYKLIENYGDRIYERVFLMSKDISPDDIWWRGDEHLLYPIQCKIITGTDSIVGISFKYAQGILHYLNDYQNGGEIHIPVYEDILPDDPRSSLVIPNPEERVVACDPWSLKLFEAPYDPWMRNDVNICELYPNLRYADSYGNGLVSLAQTDEIMQGAICIDNDPLEHDWRTWELINRLNSIAVTDIQIELVRSQVGTRDEVMSSINTSSRYNLMYHHDMQYRSMCQHLNQLAINLVAERFTNVPWKKIEIRKLWSEEVFIEIYETSNPNVISQVLYFDLPIFSLGTLGIRSSVSSYLQQAN